jgi:hypothetical protein
MIRARATAVLGAVLVLSACAGSTAKSAGSTNPCVLLAQLAQTGETVARADIADPAKFDATLHAAVNRYVRTAQRLRSTVPARLRGDVERLVAAAQQYRFDDATTARAALDSYERAKCRSPSSG